MSAAVVLAARARARRDRVAADLTEAELAYDLALDEAAREVGVTALAEELGVARWTVTRRVGRVRRAR